MPDTDVVIAGGSVAGCTLATLLGRQGVRATVLEKSPRPDHYKVVCSHFIQAGATPVLQRLGLDGTIEAAGGLRNSIDVWTQAGWYTMDGPDYGYSIRRAKLDPMLRELAATTPNVELHRGATVTEVLRDATGRPAGVRARTPGGDELEISASVVVGADGRGSDVARLAHIPGRVLPHGRFGYMAYFQDLPRDAPSDRAQMWLTGPDVLYTFPNDEGVTIAAAFLHKNRLPAFKADKEGEFLRAFAGLPRAPRFGEAQRISPMIGKLDCPNVRRPAGRPGIAFVGDAAQASDPVWGVGVGFALQSAQWLADEVAGPILAGTGVDDGLERYRRQHRRMLGLHHRQMADFADRDRLNLVERAMHRAAIHDPATARMIADLAARDRPLHQVMRPTRLARAAMVAMRA